jgi:hypothetical protein
MHRQTLEFRRNTRATYLRIASLLINFTLATVAAVVAHWSRSSIQQAHPWTVNACGEWSLRVMVWPVLISGGALVLTMAAGPIDESRTPNLLRMTRWVGVISLFVWTILLIAKDYPHCIS